MDRHTAPEYIRNTFHADDRLALVVLQKSANDVKQRTASAERIASDDFQAWLRHMNANKYEIYVSMNSLREGAHGRTKADIAQIRHVYLDFDDHGPEAVRNMRVRPDIPIPSHLIESSPGKYQAVWRVDGFDEIRAETLMRGMVRDLGADPAATDSARVLRLPGFFNHKYEKSHLVTVENLSTEIYRPAQFPQYSEEAAQSVAPRSGRSERAALPPGHLSQSERDWAYANRALARGENPQEVINAIAAHRSDKPNPRYYAELTVRKAAESLERQRQQQQKQNPAGLSLGLG